MQTLRFGARGQEVINLQEALNYQLPAAAPSLKADGIFGEKTQARLKQYQTLRGLAADGIAGPKTHGAIYNFVQNRLHMIVAPPRSSTRRFAVGDGDQPGEPVLPPIPRLVLPFPDPFRPPTPPLFIPVPKLTLGGLSTEFELSAGVQRTIARNIGTNSPDNSVSVFSDVTFSFWRRPIGKHVELSFGPGAWLQHDVSPDPKTTFRVGVAAKAELKDVLKIGPLDLFKLIVEHKTATNVEGPIELTSELEVGINPTVEMRVAGHKVEFGPKFSKFFEVGLGRHGFELKSGTTVSAGTVTVFF